MLEEVRDDIEDKHIYHQCATAMLRKFKMLQSFTTIAPTTIVVVVGGWGWRTSIDHF